MPFTHVESCEAGLTRRMLRLFVLWLAVVAVSSGASAQEESEAAAQVEESWEVIYMQGQRVGYGHSRTEEIAGDDGETIIVTDMLSHMQINRFGGQLTMTVQQHTEETEDGQLLRFRYKMDNPPISSMLTVGEVHGDEMTLETTAGGRTDTVVQEWDPESKSPAYQDRALSEDLPDEGATRTIEMYEPTLNQTVTLTVVGHGPASTDLLDGSTVEATKITLQMANFPAVDVYVDEEGETLKTEMALLGTVTYKVDEETALEEIGDEPLDLAVATLVPVERIPDAYDSKRIVYRIEVSGGGAAGYFPVGATQAVEEISDEVVELTVRAILPPPIDSPTEVAAEYLESTRFLECADPRVVEHADEAAGEATDAVEVALAMESYVYAAMKDKNFATGLATASEVARELEGDCTEHSVLLAAMLRAREIPSRVCVGVVYADRLSGFAGHMWTEAYLGGEWVPLDATMGRGGIGAAHIKVSDSSLAENAPTPVAAFLPMMHLLGKMKIEVLETE